jgi:hypothetical protein
MTSISLYMLSLRIELCRNFKLIIIKFNVVAMQNLVPEGELPC